MKGNERTDVAMSFRRLQNAHTKSSQQHRVSREQRTSKRDPIAFGSSTKSPSRKTRSPTRKDVMYREALEKTTSGTSLHSLPEIPASQLSKTFAVNVAFRVIDRCPCDQPAFISHSPVEQCLVYGEKNVYADALFPSSATVEQVGSALVPPILNSAMNGQPCVLAAYGGALTGKSTTMFGEGGVFPSYVMQLLHELQRMGLSELWVVKCSVVEVVGDTLYDRLDEVDEQRTATYHQGIRTLVIDDLSGLQRVASRLPFVGETSSEPPSSHVVVSVFVEPVLMDESVVRHLMRPLGNVHFVECCDKVGVDSNPRQVQQVKRGGVVFLNVIGALIRRSFLPPNHITETEGGSNCGASKDTYVPFQDSSLTAYLQKDLDVGKLWLLLHIDNSSAPSDACRSTVDVGMRISRERFPQGLPDPDYRAIAHREYQRGQNLNARFAQEREVWAKEKESLSSELHLIQQAYEVSLASGESSPRPSSEIQELKAKFQALQVENDELQEKIRNLTSRNEQATHQSTCEDSLTEVLSLLESTVTKLQHHALCDPQIPPPSFPAKPSTETQRDILLGAELCLLQLSHQLCEREKAISTLLKKDSGQHHKRSSCHHWQSWRRCLADLHEPLGIIAKIKGQRSTELATRPPHRSSFHSSVFCLFHTSFETMSTGFHSYWTMVQPFPSAPNARLVEETTSSSTPQPRSPRRGFTAESLSRVEVSSPPSRFDHLLEQY